MGEGDHPGATAVPATEQGLTEGTAGSSDGNGEAGIRGGKGWLGVGGGQLGRGRWASCKNLPQLGALRPLHAQSAADRLL